MVETERGTQKSNKDEDLVKRYDKGNIYIERKGEREVRSKLGTATGNFFSSKRDGERYG